MYLVSKHSNCGNESKDGVIDFYGQNSSCKVSKHTLLLFLHMVDVFDTELFKILHSPENG